MTPEQASGSSSRHRILWLDLLRLICAVEIVGFHWLRAAAKTGAFGGPQNFILSYRMLNIGVVEHFIASTWTSSSSLHRWTYDAIGLAFGFGWEAVNVFVLLSGLSLAISLGHSDRPSSWPSWIARRLKRILVPFYLVSIAAGALMFGALAFTGSRGSAALQQIHRKLMSNIGCRPHGPGVESANHAQPPRAPLATSLPRSSVVVYSGHSAGLCPFPRLYVATPALGELGLPGLGRRYLHHQLYRLSSRLASPNSPGTSSSLTNASISF